MISKTAIASRPLETWTFSIDTRLESADNRTAAVPFTLYTQPGIELEVSWGDGTVDVLNSGRWSGWDTDAALHEYASPGAYQVQIRSRDWQWCYIDTMSYSSIGVMRLVPNTDTTQRYTKNLYYFTKELTSLDSPLPFSLRGSFKFADQSNYSAPTYTSARYKQKSASYFEHIFANCTNLVSICSGLFPSVRFLNGECSGYFYNCTSLPAVPQDLLKHGEKLRGQQLGNIGAGFFQNCSSLQEIPAGFFDSCTAFWAGGQFFSNCSSLQAIPEHLLDNCLNMTRLSSMFSGCRLIREIPEELFKYNTKIYDFGGTFNGCESLTAIPENLFKYNTEATTFGGCFSSCRSLTAIPADLFRYNTKATSFNSAFSGCESLTAIPENLFKYNTEATAFSSCFAEDPVNSYRCGMTSIPAGLFRYNAKATQFSRTFCGWRNLASIPESLFASCPLAQTFQQCFLDCYGLQSIPANLFASNAEAVNFSGTFKSCVGLTSIPANLFASNANAANFDSCFWNCDSITAVPSALFANNAEATTFASCFYHCESLASIPDGLFDACVQATAFDYCFQSTAITSIPSNLFKYTTAMKTAYQCFATCNSLQQTIELHIGSSGITDARAFINGSQKQITIYVPNGSTTYSTFSGLASSLYITVVGE